MQNKIDFIRVSLARLKIYVSRATTYMSLLNSGMLIFLLLAQLKTFGINISLTTYALPVFILSMLGCIFLGYLDWKLKIYEEENRQSTSTNPQVMEILNRVKSIEEQIKLR